MDRTAWEQRSRSLVDALEDRRRALALSDGQFAAELGISRSLWSQTRSGRKRVDVALLLGVGHRFPEYGAEILALFQYRTRPDSAQKAAG